MKLTLNRVRALVCEAGKKDAAHAFDDNVIVRVGKGAALPGSLMHKTYYTRYSLDGVKRWLRLGPCDVLSTADAIKAAKAAHGDVARKRDPFAERQEKAQAKKLKTAHDALTIDALIANWEALQLKTKSANYGEMAPRAVRRLLAKHLALPAAALDRTLAVAAHDRLAKTAPIMAARAVGYAGACCMWAIRRGALTVNPFANIPTTPTGERDRVLDDEEIAAVWHATKAAGVFNAIVRMLLLTGQRREEVGGMTWDELSADGETWTLPKARAKNNVAHIVPLSPQAQAIIAAQPRSNRTTLVFPGRGGAQPFNGHARSKRDLDRASGVDGWVLHDLRRTVATNLQKLGVRLEVTEAVLNHTSGSRRGIVGVYQRHDWANEKRIALQAWGDRVRAIVEGRAMDGASNVLALRA
jgi:integrase